MARKIDVVNVGVSNAQSRKTVTNNTAAPLTSQDKTPEMIETTPSPGKKRSTKTIKKLGKIKGIKKPDLSRSIKKVSAVAQSEPVVRAKYSSKRYADKIRLNSHKIKVNSTKNRNLVYGVCAVASTVFIVIIVVLVLPLLNRPPLDDNFFVSDDTKTVVSLDAGSSDGNTRHTHMVYSYEGDTVTGLKTYFEYPDEAAAQAAVVALRDQPEFKGAVVDGKYIVVTAEEDQFKGLTASDVKQQADAIRQFQASQKPQEEKDSQEDQENEEPQDDQDN